MKLLDSLKSLITGLGTSKDKRNALGYVMTLITDAELNAMHRTDWLSRKIVDIIPNDMTREWRDWQADGKSIELIEALEASPLINTQIKVNDAMRKARLLRGACIYLGMRDKRPEQELILDNVGKGDLLYLNVLNRSEVTLGARVTDVTSEFYGEPEYYEVQGNGIAARIHPSRMIRFVGADVLDPQFETDGWGDSILQVVYTAIQNATSAQEHTAALIPEAKTDVIYIPQLSKFLANANTTEQLTARFQYGNMMKSMFNMVLLEGNGTDQGEKWEQKTLHFEKLPELIQQFLQIASGAADIPVTRLLGQAPAGLNATGDSDTRNYYDNISARQKTELTPKLNRLDEVTIRSALGKRPPEVFYTWSPLWGMTKKEKADIFKTKADAARVIVGTGGTSLPIIPIDAVSESFINALVEDGSLPGLEAAIATFGTLAEQADNPADVLAAAGGVAAGGGAAGGGAGGTAASNVVSIRPKSVAVIRKVAGVTKDAEPRTLYVRRDVVNAAEIKRWAAGQGLTDIVPDLHVTIVYSKTPIDWIQAGNASEWSNEQDGTVTIPEGGPRVVEMLGGYSAVLMFASSSLCWRHEEIVRAGASHDYESYQPHISLTKATLDPAKAIEPYRGAIVLGPEIFEEIK